MLGELMLVCGDSSNVAKSGPTGIIESEFPNLSSGRYKYIIALKRKK